jgi:RNA-splicing ligase RtcB
MMGTLGGGNHFIELDKDDDENIYLVIHTGSRNIGLQVCEYYQGLAIKKYRNTNDEVTEIVEKCKAEGRARDIEKEIRKWHKEQDLIPAELCYLTGQDMEDYLHDMRICQEYAAMNRWAIATELLNNYFYPMDVRFTSTLKLKIKEKGFKISGEGFETPHNFIDLEHKIIRKGSISAQAGERVLIPINMRDGALIACGKGIEDMNYSLPHGAGRLMSRKTAKKNINIDEFKKSMKNVYSSVVGEGTLDEAPQAYRDMETILTALDGLIDDVKIIKPIYNFKAIEKKERKWR